MINYKENDWMDTIRKVNSISPVPDYDGVDIQQAGEGEGLYGMDPKQVAGDFDTAYSKGIGGYDPFPGDRSGINRLTKLYGRVGEAYDVGDTLAAIDRTRGANLTAGSALAGNAARNFEESSLPGGSNKTGAAMIRARTLLPFLQDDKSTVAKSGEYRDSAKQKALSAASDIAAKLADLTQNYTDSLAAYNSGKAKFGLDFATSKTGLGLKASETRASNKLDAFRTNAQIAEQARAANLAAALRTQELTSSDRTKATDQILTANKLLMDEKPPGGTWETDQLGRVTSGQSTYASYQEYLKRQQAAAGGLAGVGI